MVHGKRVETFQPFESGGGFQSKKMKPQLYRDSCVFTKLCPGSGRIGRPSPQQRQSTGASSGCWSGVCLPAPAGLNALGAALCLPFTVGGSEELWAGRDTMKGPQIPEALPGGELPG